MMPDTSNKIQIITFFQQRNLSLEQIAEEYVWSCVIC